MPQLTIAQPPGFAALSMTEQVVYLQNLWDQISEDPEKIPVCESHLALAEERLKRYRADPSGVRPAFDVLDELAAGRPE